jgi:polyhydroxyalkanoate synthesis repressor PhaR
MAGTVIGESTQAVTSTPVVVKKYANRRLYNTESSSYITLDNLAELIRQGRDFVVYDAKSGEDITRGVLTQIIVEEEGKGRNLLPIAFLRQLIGFYGDQMQGLVPRYLEQSMAAFAEQQKQLRAAMQKTMGTLFPFGNSTMEEVSRQNIAMMERAFSLFTPFYRPMDAAEPSPGATGGDQSAPEPSAERAGSPGPLPAGLPEPNPAGEQDDRARADAQEIAALRAELMDLRRKLAEAKRPAEELKRTAEKVKRRAAAGEEGA